MAKGSAARVATALVEHLKITPLDGVAAILRLHSTVSPFPNPVTTAMSLFTDFRLAPLGREAMAPDLTSLRKALGNSGVVSGTTAKAAKTVGKLVELVS